MHIVYLLTRHHISAIWSVRWHLKPRLHTSALLIAALLAPLTSCSDDVDDDDGAALTPDAAPTTPVDAGSAPDPAGEFAPFQGTWVSLTCELRPGASADGVVPTYVTRRFTYEETEFVGSMTTYSDPVCTEPLMRFDFSGDLAYRGDSPIADDAINVNYVLNQSFDVVPLAQDFADLLNQAPGTCGLQPWEIDVGQDIMAPGCAALGLAPGTVLTDHDILFRQGNMLFFGARHVDGAGFDREEKRPHQLQVPMVPEQGNGRIQDGDLIEAIAGTWVSVGCELRPQPAASPDEPGASAPTPQYLSRRFRYDGLAFDGVITTYADVDCTVPVVDLIFAGRLERGGDHPVAEGAESVDYILDERFAIKPREQTLVEQLNGLPEGSCGTTAWQVDVTQEVQESGCGAFGIEPGQVLVDYDLLYLFDDMLFFGAKHVDGSAFDSDEARPVQLQVPLVREAQ